MEDKSLAERKAELKEELKGSQRKPMPIKIEPLEEDEVKKQEPNEIRQVAEKSP